MTTTATPPPTAMPIPESPAEAGAADKPRLGSRKAFLVLGGILVAVLVALGIYWLVTRGKESTDDAQVEADVVPVAAQVGGRVTAVPVLENQHVKKGDLLVQVEDVDYAARVQQAEGDLAQAQAQQAQAEAQEQIVFASASGGLAGARAALSGSTVSVKGADAQIAAAQAALERAQAEADNADVELERERRLRATNAIPQDQLDHAQLTADSTHAAVSQAQANLAAAREARRVAVTRVAEAQGNVTKSAPIEAQLAAAHAATQLATGRVQSTQAALGLAKLQLSYTRVIATDDGLVSKLAVHPGQLITAGQPMAELVPDRAYVLANFKETQIGDMHPGQRAEIAIDAYPHRKFEGQVESLSGGTGARFSLLPPDNATGNFVKVVQRVPVRIAFVDPPADVRLRAGSSAVVTVHVQ